MSSKSQTEEEKRIAHLRFQTNNKRLEAIINPLRRVSYTCDVEWRHIARSLDRYKQDFGGLDLCPDFQRGHVWTEAQQVHYIENALRGIVTAPAFVIQFNCPNWESDKYKGDLPHGFQCIDGLQRLTAVQKFIGGEINPFGLSTEDLDYSSYSTKSNFRFKLEIFEFQTRAELIQHYIDFNSGGTPHSEEEINRVKRLIK